MRGSAAIKSSQRMSVCETVAVVACNYRQPRFDRQAPASPPYERVAEMFPSNPRWRSELIDREVSEVGFERGGSAVHTKPRRHFR
jgi:hypothetical protein